MGKRHETIGIKQAIRFDWMQKTANLLLAGLDAKAIRQELHDFLADRKGNGSAGTRSAQTRTFVVNNLMKIWVVPEAELTAFRDASLTLLHGTPAMALAVHWGMISAVYPFWFNVAQHTGRLLALQEKVTHVQIIKRLKEQYGDRQTVSRYAQYVVRSFVAWGVLRDSDAKGCYEKVAPTSVVDRDLAILMLESGLFAIPNASVPLGQILNNPSFFPFQLPAMTGDFVSTRSCRIDMARYGLDDEILRLTNKK